MKLYAIRIVALLLTTHLYADSLLEKAIQYAKTHEEYVEPENKNLFYPDFTTYYKEHTPSWFRRLFGREEFSIKLFIKKIETVVNYREKKGLSGLFINALRPDKDTQLIVWGDIFGAYHSLVRDLTYLKDQGFIDENFRIIKPKCIFIFNGNVVDRSPYIIETLDIIIDLMNANPDNVFYIRGDHESKQEWHNYTLAKELQIRARSLSRDIIPFDSILDRFFNTLPLAFYLTNTEADTLNVVRISHYDRSFPLLNEKEFRDFFDASDNKVSTFMLLKEGENRPEFKKGKKVALRAILKGEEHKIVYRYNEGLLESSTQGEATSWSLFSAPTLIFQRLCDFFFDAFSIITVADVFGDTTIALYNQDVRKKDGFGQREVYNLISTQRIFKNSVHQPELLFAATMDLTKGTNTIGKRVDDGLRLRFEMQQDAGGIKGFQPRIFTFDDQYTPNITRQKVDYITKVLGIDKLVGSQGSPSLEAYLDLIKKGSVLVLFPFTGSPIFRKPDLKYVIHGARPSYEYEGVILAQYAYNILKTKRIAFFYQNDSFGEGPLKGAMDFFKDKKDVVLLNVPHERNDVSFGPQAEKLRAFNPEAILFFATSPAVRGIITLMGVDYFASRKLLGISVFEDAFEQFIKDIGITFIFTRVVPNPHTSQLEIAQEYREQSKKYDMKVDKLAFEMYINASILFYLIERINGPITKETIIDAAESIKDYDLKGFSLNFNPETRELSHTIWLDNGDGEWKPVDIRTLGYGLGGSKPPIVDTPLESVKK
jgi:ABC-type branched-subunit amino acid transport system substrate-binding protein